MAEKGRLVVLCEAMEDGYGQSTDTGAVKVTQKYKVIQVLSGESTAKEIQLHYERIPSIGERRIMKGEQVLWIVKPSMDSFPLNHWHGI